MEDDCCIICDVAIVQDCVTSPADSLERLTRLLEMVVEPFSDKHIKPCQTCENKMCQVESLLDELQVAYHETRNHHSSIPWTEENIAEDQRRYHKGRIMVVQTETIGTQTEETKLTEATSPSVDEDKTDLTPNTKVSKSRSMRKPIEPVRIKPEPGRDSPTPGTDLKCPICLDQLKTPGGLRRHLKNHGVETVYPSAATPTTDKPADGGETVTPKRRGRPSGSKVKKDESVKIDKDKTTRRNLHSNLQDHIYSELSAPSADDNVEHMDLDDEDDDDADDKVPNDSQNVTEHTPRRRYRRRAKSAQGPPYKCRTCDREFKVIYDLERHEEMVHSTTSERHACDKCDATFKWKQSLKAHQKQHEDWTMDSDKTPSKNSGKSKSPSPGKGLRSEDLVDGPPFTCGTCQKVFKLKKGLERHQMTHKDPTEGHKCDKCDVTFKGKQSLIAHQKQQHTVKQPATKDNSENAADTTANDQDMVDSPDTTERYACDRCDMTFKGKQSLNAHQKRHKKTDKVGGPPFVCDTCGKVFKYKQVLERHQQMLHTGGVTERFPCDQCSQTFKWKQSLKAHQILHSDARPYSCTLCPKAFRSAGTLKQHILSHEGTKLYQCHLCNSRFTRSMRLRIHLRSHTGELPYVCDKCGMGFADPQIFKRHMRDHNGEKPHICGDCGKGFAMARYLSEHRKGHTGERGYLCSTCGAAFANSGRLRRHMEVHNSNKLSCTMCDKTYKYKEALESHMNVHLGLKPHKCTHCDRSFTHRSSLRQHALIHTQQPKPFSCDICNKQFSTPAKVRRHAILHGVKQEKKGGTQVYEVSLGDGSLDTHEETYDGTLVLEISNNDSEAFIPPIAAVEETKDGEETAAEDSAASQSLLDVLTQQHQAGAAPRVVHQVAKPQSIQLTSSKLKAHLSKGAQQQQDTVDTVEQEVVQVVQYKHDEDGGDGEDHQVAAAASAGTHTIYLQPAGPGLPTSLGQLYTVVGSGGNILYQIQQ